MRNYDEILKSKINYYGNTKAAHELAGEEYAREIIAEQIKDQLRYLTNDQRYGLFSVYCKACGSPDPECQCWNDE